MGNDLIETFEKHLAERPLIDRSHVLSLLRFLFRVWPRIADQDWPERPGNTNPKKYKIYKDEKPTFSIRDFMVIESRRAVMYTNDWAPLEPSVDAACKTLSTMLDVCQAHGTELFVAILPDEKQISPWLRNALAKRSQRFAPEKVDYDRPTRLLAECLRLRRIEHLDLLPAFRNPKIRWRLYKPRDTHWNIAGNDLAAEHIADALRETYLGELEEEWSPGETF
jgi:hypothetical protein